MSASISIQNVSKRFNERLALAPINVEVEAGEFIALIGPSGCGKSTLLRIVADLEQTTTGRVTIDGHTPSEARAKRTLGLVSQRPAVLPWKRAEEDIAFTQMISGRQGFKISDLIREFGLSGHEHKRSRQLSGGMLQRVNLASAIAHNPSVLLMDEPFSALDEMKREEISYWLGLELLKRPKTVLFVTHHIEEAIFLADRILVFGPTGPGRIASDIRVSEPRPRNASFRSTRTFIDIGGAIRSLLLTKEGAAND